MTRTEWQAHPDPSHDTSASGNGQKLSCAKKIITSFGRAREREKRTHICSAWGSWFVLDKGGALRLSHLETD